LLSCGAALHHARIAFAALGWSTAVERMPDSGEPAHLASLHFTRAAQGSISPELLALSAAMNKRFSNHAPYSSWEVPAGIVNVLVKAGTGQGAVVGRVDNEAAVEEFARSAIRAEPLPPAGRDGVEALAAQSPSATAPNADRVSTAFESSSLDEDASIFLAVGTMHADTESLLRAGEAASAILLEATVIGLSTCLISISAEMLSATRPLRSAAIPDVADPCVVVRIGWAHVSQRPPQPSPRLPLNAIFRP
jgi:hypothetical protein